MKKILLLTMLLFCTIFASGCVTVSMERRINRDSSIEDFVKVSFDEESLSQYGYSSEYAVEIIRGYMEQNGYEVILTENNALTGRKYYATQAEFKEAMGQKDAKSVPSVDGFWFDEYETESATPFASLISSGTVENTREKHFPNIPSEETENITYEYRYCTPYSNIASNGELIESDLYTHSWTFSAVEAEYSRITITQTVPDQTGWYLTAIIAVALVVATGFCIIAFRKSRKGEKDDG